MAVAICALVGTGAAAVLLLDQVKQQPQLAPHVLSTFTLSMLAYTLVYWAGKSALTGLVSIPEPVEWAIRAVAIAAMMIGIRRLRTKRRLLIALVALVPTLILPGFDLALLGLAAALGGLCTRWHGSVRGLAWVLGLTTLASSTLSIVALLAVSPDASGTAGLQAAVVVAAAGIQAHNLRVLNLVNKTPVEPAGTNRTTLSERSLQP